MRKYIPQELVDQLRIDANETTLVLENELRQVLARNYDVKYPELMGKQIVPRFGQAVSPNARTYTYRMYDAVGTWKVINGYAQNLPRVALKATAHTGHTRDIGVSYGWDWQELRDAAFSGSPLVEDEARAARRVIEEALDYLIAFGLSDHGIPGFLNHTNVTASSVATVASNTTWEDKIADDDFDSVLADIKEMYNTTATTTNNTEKLDSLVLPETSLRQLEQTKFGTNLDKTLLQELKTQLPAIKNVYGWYRLETAGSGGVKRMVMFKRDADSCGYIIPDEFRQHELFRETWGSWVVPCTAKTGGVCAPFPLTIAYRDGI